MKQNHKHYSPIFWIHLLIDLIFIFSWILFSWWIILIGVIILQLQYYFLKGCIVSKAEFGEDEACMPYYLHKWRIINNKKKAKIFIRYILPLIIIILAIVWQVALNIPPLLI